MLSFCTFVLRAALAVPVQMILAVPWTTSRIFVIFATSLVTAREMPLQIVRAVECLGASRTLVGLLGLVDDSMTLELVLVDEDHVAIRTSRRPFVQLKHDLCMAFCKLLLLQIESFLHPSECHVIGVLRGLRHQEADCALLQEIFIVRVKLHGTPIRGYFPGDGVEDHEHGVVVVLDHVDIVRRKATASEVVHVHAERHLPGPEHVVDDRRVHERAVVRTQIRRVSVLLEEAREDLTQMKPLSRVEEDP